MKNKSKINWFTMKAVLAILAIPLVPILFFVGCATEPRHYYKIQRLNINGEIQQIYYSTSYPNGTGSIHFREYPSGKWIKFSAPYTAEDLGTNKPTL